MVDFRKLISPASRLQIRKRNDAIMEFQELGAVDMAKELLRHSRRMIDSGSFSTDPRYSYDEWALFRIIPEIALRLDPNVELRHAENPTEEEKNDPMTYLRGGSPEDLQKSITSVLSNGSFRRITLSDPDPEDVFSSEVLFSHRPNALSIATNKAFPGFSTDVATVDEREDLPGFFVIESMPSGYDCVLTYCEDMKSAQRHMDVAITLIRKEEVLDEDREIASRMRRIENMKDPVSVNIQNSAGEILSWERVIEEDLESHFEFEG